MKLLYLSIDTCPLPLFQTHTPTQTYTRQLDWQGRLEACYFCSPCHLQRTSWSSPSVTHGRALVNCNGRLRRSTVSVTSLDLLLYHQPGGVLVDQKAAPWLQSGMWDLLLQTRANCFVLQFHNDQRKCYNSCIECDKSNCMCNLKLEKIGTDTRVSFLCDVTLF